MKSLRLLLLLVVLAALCVQPAAAAAGPTYDITTLAGKVASLHGTAGLQIRFSAFIEEEAALDVPGNGNQPPIAPAYVLSSPLDGNSVQAPDVTVNQDTAAAPQNETAIAVDPNNPQRIVAGFNDYVTRTWPCTVNGTPCSALGDAYSGTSYSNDGGATWCCVSADVQHQGTLIPGVTRLSGGIYDAGGDPSLAFDSRGNVYYAGLGFDRAAPPNTVAVNRGTFDASGRLTWSAPTFINQNTSPALLNDKEWIAADHYATSRFRDRVYVSWTRYVFNGHTGAFVQSPIFLAYSSDGGRTFSVPQAVSGNVLYSQGSRPVVAPDGTVYVVWDGGTRLSSLDSIYVVKSTDGGATWSKPVAVSPLVEIDTLANTAFRNNSFPTVAAGPNGDLYVAWTSAANDAGGGLCTAGNAAPGCHAAVLYSKSTNGAANWSAPALAFPALDASTQTPAGYPVSQPGGGTLNAPAAPRRVDTLWPGLAVSPSGRVYISAYGAGIISPWQTCAAGPPPPEGRINCLTPGDYIHNARLDYFVRNLNTGAVQTVSTHPINTRNGFGGTFFGDYTDLAVGSDNTFHALWTDSNNKQSVVWFYGFEFVPTPINQEDVVTAAGNF